VKVTVERRRLATVNPDNEWTSTFEGKDSRKVIRRPDTRAYTKADDHIVDEINKKTAGYDHGPHYRLG